MGLDQYLYRKHYVQNWDHAGNPWNVMVSYEGEEVPQEQLDFRHVVYITEQIAYWRKDNHIHYWFVTHCQDGVDDCREAYVSEEQLQELLDTIRAVLKDHTEERARELLPRKEGVLLRRLQLWRVLLAVPGGNREDPRAAAGHQEPQPRLRVLRIPFFLVMR